MPSENHRHAFKHRTPHFMDYPRSFNSFGGSALRTAFRFFAANAGGIVGQNAVGALALARAEQLSQARDWNVIWEDDWTGEDLKDLCRDCEQERCHKEHECCQALLRDADGRPLASLGGIWDADAAYRRVVAAELAADALFEERRAWGQTVHAGEERR